MGGSEEGNVCPHSQVAQNLSGRTGHLLKASLKMLAKKKKKCRLNI